MGAEPIENDDVNDDSEEIDSEEADKFDQMLEKIVAGNSAGGNTNNSAKRDPIDMMMVMMMEERRQARADKNSMLKMAMTLLPTLLGNRGPDPMMIEIVKATMSGSQQKEFMQAMMAMQQQQAQSSVEMLARTMDSSSKLKDDMMERQLTMMEARMEKNNEGSGSVSPVTEIIRELRLAAEPILLAKMGMGQKTAVNIRPNITGPNGGNAGAGSGQRMIANNPGNAGDAQHINDKVIPIVLRTLKHVQTNAANIPARDKHKIRTQLATVIIDSDDLTDAILNEKLDVVVDICKPYALSDQDIAQWVMSENVPDWLTNYLLKEIAPILDAMQEAEQKANGTFVEPSQDDDEGGDDSEEASPDDSKDKT